ncbi:MAG TPA: hypothetical protein VF103_07585 [Polyangiaceae bacterium]
METTNGQPSALGRYPARLFMIQENLVLLGGAALFSAASASLLPLALSAVGEVLWLGIGTSSPAVRSFVDRRAASALRVRADRVATGSIQSLDADYSRRVLMLDRAFGDIRDIGGRKPSPTFERAVARLETLRPVYLGLCESHQRIARFLGASHESELVSEIERLKATFAAEKDLGVRLTLRQAIGLAQRRIEHRNAMAQTLRSIGIKLESVERSVAYLRSQGPTLTSNFSLLDEVETLLSEIGPAPSVDIENDAAGLAPA